MPSWRPGRPLVATRACCPPWTPSRPCTQRACVHVLGCMDPCSTNPCMACLTSARSCPHRGCGAARHAASPGGLRVAHHQHGAALIQDPLQLRAVGLQQRGRSARAGAARLLVVAERQQQRARGRKPGAPRRAVGRLPRVRPARSGVGAGPHPRVSSSLTASSSAVTPNLTSIAPRPHTYLRRAAPERRAPARQRGLGCGPARAGTRRARRR